MKKLSTVSLTIHMIRAVRKQMLSLDFKKETPTKNLSYQACCEPGLFWRSKCAKQGGRCLNECCTIKDSRRIE